MKRLNQWTEKLGVVVAIGLPQIKRKVVEQIENDAIFFPTLIHPGVLLDENTVSLGEGVVITQGCLLTVNIKIGKHALINLGCVLTHDCVIGDYCGLMPSVNVSGEVHIEEGCYIGTGSQIIQQKHIGKESVVGAGSVVVKDIPAYCTAAGTPARVIKFHN